MNLLLSQCAQLLLGQSTPQYQSGYEPPMGTLVLATAGLVIILFLIFFIIAKQIRRVASNEIIVVSRLRLRIQDSSGKYRHVNFYVQHAGARFIWPFIERVDILSTELVTIDVGTGDRFEIKNVPVKIEGAVEIKIMTDPSSVMTAAELFLNSGAEEIMRVGTHIVDGKIRAALNSLTITELSANHDAFVERVRGAVEADLGNMGLEVSGFAIYVSDIPNVEGGFRAGEEELRQL